MTRKKITIEVDDNIASELADILCWFSGYAEAKEDDWKSRWILDSVDSLRKLKIEIHSEL